MILTALFFYLFAGVCVASAFMVIAARNPVHSVLFLILAFVNAAGLFVLLGAEFLAMILIVVYVGAVAVLFLFVVMMLDVDFAELRQGFLQLSAGRRAGRHGGPGRAAAGGRRLGHRPRGAEGDPAPIPPVDQITNTEALGRVLYTDYVYYFQAAGIVLLVAMIGAIVLTLRHRVPRQAAGHGRAGARAPARTRSRSCKVRSGQGLT